jgi:hypothetical protein
MTQGVTTTTGYIVGSTIFKVTKRATPTITLYDGSGNAGKVNGDVIGVTGIPNQPSIVEHAGESTFQATRDTGGSACQAIYWQYTASAEL